MKWVFLSEGDQGLASAAHRVYLLADGLRERGHEVELFAGRRRRVGPARWWLPGPAALGAAARAVEGADALVVHRSAHPGVEWLARRARATGARVAYDFDDAVFRHRPVGLPHPLYSRLPAVLRLADVAWCGSHELLGYAGQWSPARWLPTAVDPAFLRERVPPSGPATIAWMGNGPVHVENLRLLVEPLRVLARGRRLRLVLASSLGHPELLHMFSGIEGLEVDHGFEGWVSPAELAQRVAAAHVAVMPLRDTPFNRGKCAMKALEAMAMGIPVVISPVGENLHVAGEEESFARLAGSTAEWVAQLGELLDDPVAAEELGRRGQERIDERYRPERFVEDALQSIARGS